MKTVFEYAGGTVVGRYHAELPQNNQDAYLSIAEDRYTIHLVADGCGDPMVGLHSEVGAKIGVRIVATAIEHCLDLSLRGQYHQPHSPLFWKGVKQYSLHRLYTTALSMGADTEQVIRNYFLFTLIGILITKKHTVLFGIGDGLCCVNGIWKTIGPFPNNQPPYLAYNLLQQEEHPLLDFQLHYYLKTPDLNAFLIGTDGVEHLRNVAGEKVPGEDEFVGRMEQFWEDEYFLSPVAISLRLKVLNQPQFLWTPKELKTFPGLLPDDTTFILGRRVSHHERSELCTTKSSLTM